MRLLCCHHVSLAYEGKTVVKNLNLDVHAGDYVCIVGENGSGKSTLMRALLGLKKATAGHVSWENGVTCRDIGYMPQRSAINADFPATVFEVVRAGLRTKWWRPFLTAAEKAQLYLALETLEIADIRNQAFSALSGGQQQRVLLARAVCAAKKVLLLDEPVAGLDPTITAQLYATIQKLHQNGMTIVMISHDIPASMRYATHILHLQHEPAFFGTTDTYAASEIGKRFLERGHD